MSSIEMIRAAHARLSGHVRQTPILTSPFLDEIAGRRVLVKAECLQHTGSFKFRGGFSALSGISDAQRAGGVIAYSSGNHAQGVAYAAKLHGVAAVIVMPSDAPKLKIANTRAFGAEVVLYDRFTEDRDAIGQRIAAERGLTLIKPYDEPLVIAGQGTLGLELGPQLAAHGMTSGDVLVCCGGGGLTSGVALALADVAPGLRARPVEPEGFDDVGRSLISGKIETNAPNARSICDAIVTPSPGKVTFPFLQKHCGPGLSVTDKDALRAVAQAFSRLKIVAEPGGAVALAAALFQPELVQGEAVAVVITGGNVDADVFTQALAQL
jgi:threonine dehydratase